MTEPARNDLYLLVRVINQSFRLFPMNPVFCYKQLAGLQTPTKHPKEEIKGCTRNLEESEYTKEEGVFLPDFLIL